MPDSNGFKPFLFAVLLLLLAAIPSAAQQPEGFVDTLSTAAQEVKVDLSKYELTTPNGKSGGTLADFDKYVYVDVWATWCQPCLGEIPNLKAAQERLGGDDFTVIGLSIDESSVKLKVFLAENEETYPIFHDPAAWKAEFVRDFGIQGIPSLFLFAPDGRLIGRDIRGPGMADQLEQLIRFDGYGKALEMKFGLDAANYDELVKVETLNIGGQPRPVPVAQGDIAVKLAAAADRSLAAEGERLEARFFAVDYAELQTLNPQNPPKPDWQGPLTGGELAVERVIPGGTLLFSLDLVVVDVETGEVKHVVRELWGSLMELGPQS